MEHELLTVTQAAEFLQVKRDTLYKWLNSGRIKKTYISTQHYRIAKNDLIAYLASVGKQRLEEDSRSNE